MPSAPNYEPCACAAMLGMLDGLLPLLVRALRSRHAAVASLALRCLALLVPLPLPGTAVSPAIPMCVPTGHASAAMVT